MEPKTQEAESWRDKGVIKATMGRVGEGVTLPS